MSVIGYRAATRIPRTPVTRSRARRGSRDSAVARPTPTGASSSSRSIPDEAEANRADPVLRAISDPEVRSTLVAREEDGALRFDVHLQGDGETAFFAV